MKADDVIEALAIAEYGDPRTWPIMPENGRDVFRQDAREVRNRLSAAGFAVVKTEELEAALKPFAKFADALKDEVPDTIALGLYCGGDIQFGPDSASIGDLRRARAVLSALTEETER